MNRLCSNSHVRCSRLRVLADDLSRCLDRGAGVLPQRFGLAIVVAQAVLQDALNIVPQ